MPLIDYTSYAEVRAVLGVDIDELPDATLALNMYAASLKAELRDVATTLLADLTTVKAVTPDSDRTDAQQAFLEAVQLFAPYAVAKQLASGLPLFAPKMISDGKASVVRDSNSPQQKTIDRVCSEFQRLKAALATAHAELAGAAAPATLRTFLLAATPSTDPVVDTE